MRRRQRAGTTGKRLQARMYGARPLIHFCDSTRAKGATATHRPSHPPRAVPPRRPSTANSLGLVLIGRPRLHTRLVLSIRPTSSPRGSSQHRSNRLHASAPVHSQPKSQSPCPHHIHIRVLVPPRPSTSIHGHPRRAHSCIPRHTKHDMHSRFKQAARSPVDSHISAITRMPSLRRCGNTHC
jgi:hypothetical protein